MFTANDARNIHRFDEAAGMPAAFIVLISITALRQQVECHAR
jgi:hypothetical protein